MKAYCWSSGYIEFGRSSPAGAIVIASGEAKVLRTAVMAVARQGYDGQTILVPGIPEAKDDRDKVDALLKFCKQLKLRLGKRASP